MEGGRALRRSRAVSLICTVFLLAAAAHASASGITNSADDLRTGWYPEQPTLTPQLVSGGTFGQLWSTPVSGQVYAQPLLADGTLVVATENNLVYGIDPSTGAQKWAKPLSLGTPWNPSDIGCGDLAPTIGVTATPVIDPATNTAYLTHKTYASGSSGAARWYLDAVDITTGVEKSGFPVLLSGAAQNAPGQTFQPTTQLQRPGLLLLEGVVYAAFGSDCDDPPWQGWVFGVSTAGAIKARWVTVSSGNGAGIWQSGAGLSSDGPGTMMLSTGNGGAPSTPAPGGSPPANLGESVVRLRVQSGGTLKATDFFAPFDAASLDGWDADFASGGVTGLPESAFGTPAIPHLAVAVGKQGYVYLLNRDSLGGIGQGPSGADNVVQRIGPYGGVWSRPGVWPGDGGWVYIPTASGGNSASGSAGNLRVYQYGLSGSGTPALSLQASSSDAFGFSSSAPVITSDGTTSGSALVWIVWAPNGGGAGAQLRAYDPIPVGGHPVLRWSGPVGTSSKFAIPGVGAGRLYVGTRDGHVLAFGSPVTPVLSGSATAFPTTTVGSSSQRVLTLTATQALTLTGLSSSSSQFTLATPEPALPASLAAGQSIQVPITFAPTATGLLGASVTATTSTGKTATFALSGSGQAAAAKLEASPPLVTFGGTTVGGHLSGSATFRNVGAAPLTVNAVHLPSAPFGASGVPAAGSTIAAGAAVTITLSFEPTADGTFSDQIELETTGGNVAVGLSGSAGAPGALQIASENNEYGSVAVGSSSAKTFTVTNTGGTTVTITKSKPPSGGAFAATTSLAEGTTIAPGASVSESVTFAPSATGPASGSWTINGDDATGLHTVNFTGTGVAAPVPPPATPAWSLNGTATIAAGVLKLTGTTTNSAGSSFYKIPLASAHLTVAYDQTIGGGTGADGIAVVLADPASATPASLGANGAGLGFYGIRGAAIGFDTHKTSSGPSSNFVGIADSTKAIATAWAVTSSAIPALRSGSHHIVVSVQSGTISVSIDGTQAVSRAVNLPPTVLLGFSGATSSLTDNHQVANVHVEGAPPAPPAATLKLTNTVNAPSGSPQAATQLVLSGSCPSAFTTAALGNGANATPALSGAVAGASCSVSEEEPAAGNGSWRTTASINGAAPVTLSASGGKLTVPAFALIAGANTVALTSSWTEASSSAVPDPSAGGWQLNGSSALSGAELVLTPATAEKAGSAFWPQPLDPRNLTIEYDASIGGGTGADGLALVFADPARGATPTSLGLAGGGLGFSGIPGFAVALDEFKNSANPSNNFAGISDGPTSTAKDLLHWLATANLASALQGATHHVTITTAAGTVSVAIDGAQVLTQAVSLPASAYLGFSAGTGGSTNRHAIAHLHVLAAAPMPATLTITNAVQAPAGSSQAEATFAVSGSCPSTFTTAALAGGASESPTLTGAVAGSSCTVSEPLPAAPAGGRWSATASVDGGTPQALTVNGSTATLPAFALRAGANTIALSNTYQPPSASLVPDPSAGGWKLNGSSALSGAELVLTPATAEKAGSAFWPTALDPRALRIEYEATIGGGTGADGLALVFADPARGAKTTSLGTPGGGLGFSGIPGFAVALDEFKNAVNPSNDFTGVADGPATGHTDMLHWLGTANLLAPLQNATHKITVTTSSTAITVAVDGTQVLSQLVSLPASAYLGFSAGTGGSTNRHAIAHLTVLASP